MNNVSLSSQHIDVTERKYSSVDQGTRRKTTVLVED